MKSLSRARLFATPWTAAYQAPPSMGFSRQEYWSWGAIALHATSTVVTLLNSSTYLILLDVAYWLLKLLGGKGSQSTNISLVPGAGLCIKVRKMFHSISISNMSRIAHWHADGTCSGVWNSAYCLALSKLENLSVLLGPHLYKGENDSSCPTGLSQRQNSLILSTWSLT